MPLTRNTTLELFKPSGIRRFSALAAATPGCISLTIGEPGEDTPAPICNLVDRELAAGTLTIHLTSVLLSLEELLPIGSQLVV